MYPSRSPCFTSSNLPAIPSPTTCCRPRGLVWFPPRAYRVVRRPHPSRNHGVTWTSPFPSRLATTTGRIEFVNLRTGRSPPVASHPSSRRRSYLRLQSSNPTPTGTSTPLIQRARRRTRTAFLGRLFWRFLDGLERPSYKERRLLHPETEEPNAIAAVALRQADTNHPHAVTADFVELPRNIPIKVARTHPWWLNASIHRRICRIPHPIA